MKPHLVQRGDRRRHAQAPQPIERRSRSTAARQAREPGGDPQGAGGREHRRHRRPRAFRGARLHQRRQDRHGAGDHDRAGREVQRLAAGRAPPRPRAVHGVRAGRGPEDRDRDGGGERRLRRRECGADRAPRVRLLADGPVPERGRPGRGAEGPGHDPDRQAAQCERSGLAARRRCRRGSRRPPVPPATPAASAATVAKAAVPASAPAPAKTTPAASAPVPAVAVKAAAPAAALPAASAIPVRADSR